MTPGRGAGWRLPAPASPGRPAPPTAASGPYPPRGQGQQGGRRPRAQPSRRSSAVAPALPPAAVSPNNSTSCPGGRRGRLAPTTPRPASAPVPLSPIPSSGKAPQQSPSDGRAHRSLGFVVRRHAAPPAQDRGRPPRPGRLGLARPHRAFPRVLSPGPPPECCPPVPCPAPPRCRPR